ncbi:hypothetical protein QBC41DRAFT_306434 [Cercophora samala]|uniref:Uncharacterized protein n=1 Tax=Cercophora samala TaxID=330535 RepID=A0AA39Z681_9PEZI|nr:hypothetical protein QBC41DRAFT_306434 [Cercophora samala]
MSLARLKTEVTAPLAQPTESSEGAEVTAPNSSSSTWSQGALIAVIIAPIIAVVFLAIGIFFIIRRHRGRPKGNGQSVHDGAQNNDDGPTAHEKNTEIEAKTELSSNGHFAWEMPADRGTMELSRHNEAWELENTQTTPELPASHGMAEMDARRDGGLRGSRRG